MGRYGEIWRDLGRYGEIWGDLGRSGEIWGDLGRYGKIWGDLARSGEIWGDMARSGEIWGDALRSSISSRCASSTFACSTAGLVRQLTGRVSAPSPPLSLSARGHAHASPPRFTAANCSPHLGPLSAMSRAISHRRQLQLLVPRHNAGLQLCLRRRERLMSCPVLITDWRSRRRLSFPGCRLYLGYISARSRLHLGYISARSRLHLCYISPLRAPTRPRATPGAWRARL